MSRPWDPQVEVDEALARRLVEARFPTLVGARFERAGAGMDNVVFRVGGRWAFRFPRRDLGAQLLARERWVTARLGPRLPVLVAPPVFIGGPSHGYPYAFVGVAWRSGRTACALDAATTSTLAASLGAALARLHGVAPTAEDLAEAPRDTLRKADLAFRRGWIGDRLHVVPDGIDAARVDALAAELAQTTPWDRGLRWVHGDLYARHVVVGADGGLAGLIDWGDAHLGDPALDLSIAWTLFEPDARGAFRAAYGEVDEATWKRARFRGLFYGVALIEFGADIGDAALERCGRRALAQALG